MRGAQVATSPVTKLRSHGSSYIAAIAIAFGCLIAQPAGAATCESLTSLCCRIQPLRGRSQFLLVRSPRRVRHLSLCTVASRVQFSPRFAMWQESRRQPATRSLNLKFGCRFLVGMESSTAMAMPTSRAASTSPAREWRLGFSAGMQLPAPIPATIPPSRPVEASRSDILSVSSTGAIVQHILLRSMRRQSSKRITAAGRATPIGRVAQMAAAKDSWKRSAIPEDYDAIEAVAPVNFWTHLYATRVWDVQATTNNPASYIPSTKLPMITAAAVAACDALDGVVDSVIDDPRRCNFDPAVLLCSGADAPTCLTAPQVEAVKKIYAGPTDPRMGQQIFPGLEPGSESSDPSRPTYNGLSWAQVAGGFAAPCPAPVRRNRGSWHQRVVTSSSISFSTTRNWDFRKLNFDTDITLADQKMAAIINSTNPDLSAFRARGGKLIVPQGWADTLANPRNAINYYESVVRNIAGAQARSVIGGTGGPGTKPTNSFACSWYPEWDTAPLDLAPITSGSSPCYQGRWDPAQNVLRVRGLGGAR